MSQQKELIKNSISLHTLLKALDDNLNLEEKELLSKFSKIHINSITSDSRKVNKGDLFIAYKGTKEDGHKYIKEAIKNGARAVLTEKYQKNLPIPHFRVKDGRKALAMASDALYDYPSTKMMLTGITGTNGKTSTTLILDHLLSSTNKKTGLIGTIYNKINNKSLNSSLTTPTAPDLHKTLSHMYDEGVEYVTMEVSSHSLKEKRVSEIDFNIAGVTNFSFDHPEYHPDYKDYFLSKAKLFKLLKPESFAIINVDDPNVIEFCSKTRAKTITYSLNYSQSMIKISNLNLKEDHSTFLLKINEEIPTVNNKIIPPDKKEFFLPLPGRHHVYNSALAIAAALVLEVNLEDLSHSLAHFPGIYRRFQILYKNEFKIIDDFAHNPEGIKAVLNTIKKIDFNSIIPVVAIRGGRGMEINQNNAATLSHKLKNFNYKKLILTKYVETASPSNEVNPKETKAFCSQIKKNKIDFELYDELTRALERALELVEKNDIILLLGGEGINQGQKIIKNLRPGKLLL